MELKNSPNDSRTYPNKPKGVVPVGLGSPSQAAAAPRQRSTSARSVEQNLQKLRPLVLKQFSPFKGIDLRDADIDR